MKSVFALAALLAFAVVTPVAAVPPAPLSATLAGRADSVTLPVEILGGHVYVKTKVNGIDGRFVLDSGAGIVVLTPEFARKLGFLAGGKKGTATGVGGNVKIETAALTTLETGGARLENVLAAVIPMPQALEADGLLGFEYFQAFVVTLDYENARLTLTKPKKFQPTGDGLPLKVTRTPAVEVSLDGHKAQMEVDTGANGGVTFNTPFVEREQLRENYSPRFEMPTGRGVGGVAYGTVARAKSLTLGAFHLSGPIVEMSRQKVGAESQKEDDGRIGYDVLSRFVVTFDYERKKLYLTPNARLAAPFVYNRSGLGFDVDGFKTSIVHVIPGSPGEQAGIKVGDEVLAVNDVIVSRLPKGTLRRLTSAAPGTPVKFTLRRAPAEAPFTANVVLRDLL